jgi:glycosyltransferase involved in cell wall biosynthesis
VRATVIVPTHDHGPLIEYAVGSALSQTERDIEVIIVGDGVPGDARSVIERVAASDDRVRFLDHPKARGHGFRHRDKAIREARSENILYLCDDDLWFPEHVELLCDALEESEFVASLPVAVTRKNLRLKAPHDLANPRWRKYVIAKRSMLSLSFVGHKRALYDRLKNGWRRNDTDYYAVWRDCALRSKRLATVPRVTGLVLSDGKREDMSAPERLAELAQLSEQISAPAGRLALLEQLLEYEVGRWSQAMVKLERLSAQREKKPT